MVHSFLWIYDMTRLKNLHLLFLEDNLGFAKNTIEFLENYFAKITHVTTIKEALYAYEDYKIDVIFSDINVEDGNGLDFIQKIRLKNKEIPIVVLSAHKDENFLFQAIPLHITKYQLKPISYSAFMELLQSVAQLFTHTTQLSLIDELSYNFLSKELLYGTKPIKLTKKEILFIELLLQNKTQVITNEMIQRSVWQENIMSDSAIKNLIFRLRKKVPKEFIRTLQGVGYKLLS